MKVIIAGSRDFHDYDIVLSAIKESQFNISEVVSGGANGVDAMGEQYAEENNIILKIYPADWKKHGNAAGPIRNKQMAKYADALIAIQKDNSKGTKNMIETALKEGLKVYVRLV